MEKKSYLLESTKLLVLVSFSCSPLQTSSSLEGKHITCIDKFSDKKLNITACTIVRKYDFVQCITKVNINSF